MSGSLFFWHIGSSGSFSDCAVFQGGAEFGRTTRSLLCGLRTGSASLRASDNAMRTPPTQAAGKGRRACTAGVCPEWTGAGRGPCGDAGRRRRMRQTDINMTNMVTCPETCLMSRNLFLYLHRKYRNSICCCFDRKKRQFLYDVENNRANARVCAGIFLLASVVWRKPFG